jgi:hypothetical protein
MCSSPNIRAVMLSSLDNEMKAALNQSDKNKVILYRFRSIPVRSFRNHHSGIRCEDDGDGGPKKAA